MLFADGAFVVIQGIIECKHCRTSCSGTPRSITAIGIHEAIEGKAFVLLSIMIVHKLVDIVG